MDRVLAWSLAIAAVGGLVRGTTGFGASMVMTPALALLLGARVAVPVALLLETFAAAPMIPAALALARWRAIAPICASAVATVPVGALLLGSASPLTLRRLIAATVTLFSLALLSGRRYAGAPRLRTALGLGALSGTLLGATSVGGPPVILYLLSGPDPVPVTRANLTLYVIVISAAGLVMLGAAGLLSAPTLARAAALALPFGAGVVAGGRAFARFSDRRFRQFTIGFMLVVSLGVLLA
ncbi:MAG: sulfite exporter TauE/SafE family protein [Burkholderiales bacterium]|nr:sulfite exporter TauE/SafE family protein [Burkholderiales bacterium]